MYTRSNTTIQPVYLAPDRLGVLATRLPGGSLGWASVSGSTCGAQCIPPYPIGLGDHAKRAPFDAWGPLAPPSSWLPPQLPVTQGSAGLKIATLWRDPPPPPFVSGVGGWEIRAACPECLLASWNMADWTMCYCYVLPLRMPTTHPCSCMLTLFSPAG